MKLLNAQEVHDNARAVEGLCAHHEDQHKPIQCVIELPEVNFRAVVKTENKKDELLIRKIIMVLVEAIKT